MTLLFFFVKLLPCHDQLVQKELTFACIFYFYNAVCLTISNDIFIQQYNDEMDLKLVMLLPGIKVSCILILVDAIVFNFY